MRLDHVPLKKIKKALQDDGVWVSPQLRSEVSKADESRIEKAVDAAKPKPVYVALVEVPYDDPLFHGEVGAMFTVISDDTGIAGTFIGMETYDEPTIAVEAIGGDTSNASYAGMAAHARHPDDLADQVVDAVTMIDKGNAIEVYNEVEESRPSDETYAEGDDFAVDTGLAIALVAAAVVVVGVGLYVRARRRRSAEAGFQLPVNVLTTVREAERRRLLERANGDVLRLGERIDAATMEGATGSWRAALDHYDRARDILDASSEPADVVGVIVLCERGSHALDAAIAGREWVPTTSCYFNPLHGESSRKARWGGENGVDVPACRACADAIGAGRTPDALAFVRDGVPQHYFTLDLEPWSSSGYGALDPDLLAQLHRR